MGKRLWSARETKYETLIMNGRGKKANPVRFLLHPNSQIACELFSPREYIPKSLEFLGSTRQNGQSGMKISRGGQTSELALKSSRRAERTWVWRHTYEGELDQPDKDLHCLITCPYHWLCIHGHLAFKTFKSFQILWCIQLLSLSIFLKVNDTISWAIKGYLLEIV